MIRSFVFGWKGVYNTHIQRGSIEVHARVSGMNNFSGH